MRAAYTWSKIIDLTSGFRSRSSTYTDPLDPRLDRAVADFDVPQRLVISGIWQLPLDRHIDNGFMKKVAGGWQFNGIATFQGGQPFTLYSDNDSSQQGNGLDRPDIDRTDSVPESAQHHHLLRFQHRKLPGRARDRQLLVQSQFV